MEAATNQQQQQQQPANPIAQQFNLKWTNHTNNILQVLTENYLKESLVDVTLTCEGQYIKAHKMILSACSLYFQEAFEIYKTEHPLVMMNGIRFNVLKQVVEFMYRGEIKVNDCDLEGLLLLAENLQVKGLCSVRVKPPQEAENHSGEPAANENPAEDQKLGRKRKKSPSPEAERVNSNANTPPVLDGNNSAIIPSLGEMLKEQQEKDTRLGGIKAAEPPPPKKNNNGNDARRNSDEFLAAALMPTIAMDGFMVDDGGGGGKNDEKINKIPRPPNAFMIFANEWRKKLACEHPGESNKDISIRLGLMWKSLTEETKNAYYRAAKKADQQHKAKYPGYYYSPKEARMRKAIKPTAAAFRKAKSLEPMRLRKITTFEEQVKQITAANEDEDVLVVDDSDGAPTEMCISVPPYLVTQTMDVVNRTPPDADARLSDSNVSPEKGG